jgi:uncharacterized Zn finger protein (UPF0148 family)
VSDRIVRCPICQEPLAMHAARLVCPACGHRPVLPVVERIPERETPRPPVEPQGRLWPR